MFGRKREHVDLLAYIREGREMTQGEKLRLIISLSIPSILAQISATVMFFIDASMVGHLGAKASASIGLGTGYVMSYGDIQKVHQAMGNPTLWTGIKNFFTGTPLEAIFGTLVSQMVVFVMSI